ncbi:amino acid permease [Amnibacterium endophyticum]|uniref:Amino acid permease n=1 Tax=Amnibacterium endophyticum TaxID=2109337 RepID=A0ABW4LAU8_9MICO
MSNASRPSSVTYRAAEEGYFEKRQLKRSAGFWGIWGLGVAAVISGMFSGWNFGTASAGFGGMAIATAVVIVMYFCLLFSIGEMSAAMPHTGGAYSFARAALGPWGGYVTGLAETIEYVMTTAVVVFFAGQYADGALVAFTGLSLPQPIWWALLYVVFLGVNILGAAVGFRLAIVVAVLSIAILGVFVVVAFATSSFSVANLFDVEPAAGRSAALPNGLLPVLFVLPFAMWFFLGIEELPLAAEETHEPQRVIPKAGFWGLVTLLVCAVAVFVVNTGVLGATATGSSLQPLLDGFDAMVPSELAGVLALFALIGLLASLQGIMYAYGRNMYSLSRAGYYPQALSLTGQRQTPWVALLVGGVIGYAALVLVQVTGGDSGVAGAVVLNIAVWGAVISYMLQMVSFIVLRRRFPRAVRPYRSPVGVPGAVVAGVISLAIFVGFFLTGIAAYLIAIAGIAVVYVVGLVLFAAIGRHRLVLSPEEEYAQSGGLHRDPEVEEYEGRIPVA